MRLLSKSLFVIFAILFSFGCATKQAPLPPFEAVQFDSGQYASKVDNFLILFDASGSLAMDGTFETAREVVIRMNQTIPELGQTAGLRSFGHDPSISKKETELFYGMEKYNTAALGNQFAKISKAGGFSPINAGLDAAGQDLKGLPGQNAVVIVSDGKDLPRDVLDAAKRLKGMYGDAICFYTIHVGASESGKALLKEVAGIGGCGFAANAEDLLTSSGMANFVENAFLQKKGAAPAAPAVKMDTDKDGVTDDMDKCPGTPIGARVNRAGCWVLDNVLFDFDKATIRAVAQPMLFSVVSVLEQNPGMKVELQGHCDNIGTREYNQDLSERRAAAVKAYLVSEGIASSRITTKGYGFSKPTASNDTDQGRALNRRVEINPIK